MAFALDCVNTSDPDSSSAVAASRDAHLIGIPDDPVVVIIIAHLVGLLIPRKKTIICHLVVYPKPDQQRNGHADGQTEDILYTVQSVAQEAAKGGPEVVLEHDLSPPKKCQLSCAFKINPL
jgi:hypothetical protein